MNVGSYDVRIGAQFDAQFADLIRTAAPAHHYAVVSDSTVAPLHAHRIGDLARGARTSLHVLPPGESHKTREEWGRITDELLDRGAGRDTAVIALGGGVVGDLAGFVAAAYMRGVPVIQIPTTLLAMIDASVGGKTGVDTPHGKNLVGAFHPPSLVVADVAMLVTLPRAHRRAGLAEAVKHGVICDAAYFARVSALTDAVLEADETACIEVVRRSVEIKAEVVLEDLHEHGRRKTLNFGHTIGHAIETLSAFSLLHGECVAIGMVAEARIAERLGIASAGVSDALQEVLVAAGLPVDVPSDMSRAALMTLMQHDKKARSGAIEYALPASIGSMARDNGRWAIAAPSALVLEVLA